MISVIFTLSEMVSFFLGTHALYYYEGFLRGIIKMKLNCVRLSKKYGSNVALKDFSHEFVPVQMATFFGRFCGAKRPRCVASGQIVFDL